MKRHAWVVLLTTVMAWAEEKPADEAAFLTSTRQLTFAGKRAGEGYFSKDGRKLIFQSEREAENPFYQIYLLDLETGDLSRVSPGQGKTTCAWLHPDGQHVIFASTHADPKAKEKQEAEIQLRASGKQKRYSWDYDETYEIWRTDLAGQNPQQLTSARGYDAEGNYSPDGQWIVFASNRHGFVDPFDKPTQDHFAADPSLMMEIYRMRADGTEVTRLTNTLGYDGGPFFSADGQRICWRRFNEQGDKAEVWTMKADGSDQRQITKLGAMSWAPFFHPSGEYLIFTTNLQGLGNFEIYMVDAQGTKDPIRVTHTDGFDGLPVFSPDGRSLAWTSNRTSNQTSQIFLAAWNHEAARKALGISTNQAGTPAASPGLAKTKAEISPEDLRRHLTYLASDELKGRLTGSEGERLATDYAAKVFASSGLSPAGDGGTYFQEFRFTAGVELDQGNRLVLREGEAATEFAVEKDWLPVSFSNTGGFEPSEIVFAGYGIEMPEETKPDGGKWEAYSSYAHLDVKGKWVLMFRFLPRNVADEQRQRFANYSSLRYKALTARERGAAGILVVSGPNSEVNRQLAPLTFDASLAGSGIGVLSISDGLGEKILGATGKSLKELQDKLDTGDLMGGIAIPNQKLEAQVKIREEKRTGRNVLARLASGSTEPAILFGAHIDHLGEKAGGNSLARDEEQNKIHYGADDNASGVAGLFEAAEWLASLKANGKLALRRDLLFAAWSGEELGLLGSNHFARQAAKELGNEDSPLKSRFAACLNMDMIGRLRKSLILQGLGSSEFWPGEVEKRNVPLGLSLTTQSDVYLPTDASTFYLRGIPILNAFTGAHEEYHTPRDTVATINFDGAAQVTRFMAAVARSLAIGEEIPKYNPIAKQDKGAGRAGMRVFLGTIPDYAQGDIVGVKLSGVRGGSPADKAGLKGGDVIVKLATKDIKNIYDYTFILEALVVGRETEIVVKRGEESKTLKIVPASRD